jgi:CRISPR-associated protein Cas5h
MKALSFEIAGALAHYKKIYATTSALTYAIPSKTAMYGYVGAILGLNKEGSNSYLSHFEEGSCLIGLQIMNPIRYKRVNTNLRPTPNRFVKNRKPTSMEYVAEPRYRVYFWHKEQGIYNRLKQHLEENTAVYTPTLGLSNLLSSFEYKGEVDFERIDEAETTYIHSVFSKEQFDSFDHAAIVEDESEIMEISMYAFEMNQNREVTRRGDVLLERRGKPVKVRLLSHYKSEGLNISFF